MFLFFPALMFLALFTAFLAILSLTLLAFKLHHTGNVYSLAWLPLFTVFIFLLWFALMALVFDFPLQLWAQHGEYVMKIILTGVGIGLLILLSTKMWTLEKLNQFIRQSVSVILLAAVWLVISVIYFFTMAMSMELS